MKRFPYFFLFIQSDYFYNSFFRFFKFNIYYYSKCDYIILAIALFKNPSKICFDKYLLNAEILILLNSSIDFLVEI